MPCKELNNLKSLNNVSSDELNSEQLKPVSTPSLKGLMSAGNCRPMRPPLEAAEAAGERNPWTAETGK